jgi:hypothetical protein
VDALAVEQGLLLNSIAEDGVITLVSWPMSQFTDVQIIQAKTCDLEELVEARYTSVDETNFRSAYPPVNACDYAALAAAYVYRASETGSPEPLPDEGWEAYRTAVFLNPAFALKNVLISGYLGSTDLVEPPPITEKPVTDVEMHYSFGGIGYWSDITINIHQADTEIPVVSGTVIESVGYVGADTPDPNRTERELTGTIDPALIQRLGQSVTDMVPVDNAFEVIACYDYYPGWQITVTYQGGTVLNLRTLGNMLAGGGPWHMELDGQDYIQIGYGIPGAVEPITEALDIPAGTTAAMMCGGMDRDILELAFPDHYR